MSFGLRPFGTRTFAVDPQNAQVFNESVSDSLTLTDTASAAVVWAGIGSDTLTLADAGTNTLDMVATASDDLTLTDSATADVAGGQDTHDGWLDYRKRVQTLAKLAEERRQATVEEAEELKRDIAAAISEADDIVPMAEVEAAVAVVEAVTPRNAAPIVAEDWSEVIEALRKLHAAIAYQMELEADDEDVLLLT